LTKWKKEKSRVPKMGQIKEEALRRIKQYFPKSRGKPRVDDRRVIRGIIYVLHNGLKGNASKEYGPYKMLYNRFVRWSRLGVFTKTLQKLSKEGTKVLMIDATYLKVHRTTASLKGRAWQQITCVCDGFGRPVRLLLTAENVNDIVGAGELLKDLPEADYLLADKRYDANWFREELMRRGVEPCIPYISTHKTQRPYNTVLYKQRHKIENVFCKLKD
jgi:transposase